MSNWAYRAKTTALAPRTAWRRHRLGRDLDELGRAMMEAQYYRGPMIEFVEAMADDPDLLTTYELGPDCVAIDLGAYLGQWAGPVSDRYGATVHAFEPNPVAFERLEAALGDRSSVHLHPVGLGARDETLSMGAIESPGASVYAAATVWGTKEVQLLDADQVFRELGLDHIDVLKVNIEGSEYDLLEHLDRTGWLPRVGELSVQFHEWHPRSYARRRSIRRTLRRTHTLVWDYPWVWERWRLAR